MARLFRSCPEIFPQNRAKLGLAKHFADEPLADCVTPMTSRPRVECGTSGSRIILRHVRGDIERAAGRDEIARVIALIAPQRDPMTARQSFATMSAFGCLAGCSRNHSSRLLRIAEFGEFGKDQIHGQRSY